jgi:DNA-binding HxlR family transcriptional regulator
MSIPPERLAEFFKTLGDENRLKIINLLNKQERNVGEIAAVLEVREPTVSHHLSKLREMGLVNLRQAGNQRYYRLNDAALEHWKQAMLSLENLDFDSAHAKSDDRWIDKLDIDETDRKVLRDYMHHGRLKQIPTRRKKLMVVLRWLAGQFEADKLYSEREVNDILAQYHEDYASLRRDLVESNFLRRERDGSTYWKA